MEPSAPSTRPSRPPPRPLLAPQPGRPACDFPRPLPPPASRNHLRLHLPSYKCPLCAPGTVTSLSAPPISTPHPPALLGDIYARTNRVGEAPPFSLQAPFRFFIAPQFDPILASRPLSWPQAHSLPSALRRDTKVNNGCSLCATHSALFTDTRARRLAVRRRFDRGLAG